MSEMMFQFFEFPGVTKEQYDAAWRDLGTGGKMLPGNTFHVGGPMPGGGWWAVNVWESAEAAQKAFQKIGPTLARHGFPQVQPRILEVDRVVRESVSGAS